MYENEPAPLSWLRQIIGEIQWPVIVAASFWVGRYVRELEMRVSKTEDNVQALVERHMPTIHRALAEIRGLLTSRR
jgi:hypothetical protein